MSSFYYTGDADNNKRQFVAEIEHQKRRIKKDFADMDIENATAKDQLEAEVESILSECDSLISLLEEM